MAFTYNFTAIADGASLAAEAEWTATANDFRGGTGGGLVEPTGDTDSVVRYTSTTPANDQYAQAALTLDVGTNDQSGIGVGVRWDSGAAFTGYHAIVCAAGSNNVSVVRWNATAYSLLAQRTTTWSPGDVLKLQVVTTGGSQATLKVYKNGSQLGADIVDNAAANFIAGGQTAVVYMSSLSEEGTLDNFEGDDVTAGGPTVTLPWLPRHTNLQGPTGAIMLPGGMTPPNRP